MSRLLDGGANYEPVTVYPEEAATDGDGNTITRPAAVGRPAMARIQISNQSGTSARRAEQDNEGFESEQVYNLRFSRACDAELGVLGAQSEIEWGLTPEGKPQRWTIFGDAQYYNGSRRTAHRTYTLKRY